MSGFPQDLSKTQATRQIGKMLKQVQHDILIDILSQIHHSQLRMTCFGAYKRTLAYRFCKNYNKKRDRDLRTLSP